MGSITANGSWCMVDGRHSDAIRPLDLQAKRLKVSKKNYPNESSISLGHFGGHCVQSILGPFRPFSGIVTWSTQY